MVQSLNDVVIRDDDERGEDVCHKVGYDDNEKDEEKEGAIRPHLIHIVQILELSHR